MSVTVKLTGKMQRKAACELTPHTQTRSVKLRRSSFSST